MIMMMLMTVMMMTDYVDDCDNDDDNDDDADDRSCLDGDNGGSEIQCWKWEAGDADDNVAGYAGSVVVIMVDDGTLHFCWHYCLSSSPKKESKDHTF